ncbi:MAG TPA: class I SAM-dependent methyltransferase [Pirellulales bacterium]|nr:class I SAM-dependent methyltransferase [Pirellulales bacterium]
MSPMRGGGHEAYGTEGSPEVVELLNKSYPGWFTFVPGCDYRSQFEDGTFDLVYLEHVFEHLPEAPSLIEQFWHLLAPGGVLMIMVPNHACRRARHLGLRFDGFTPPAHLFYFTPESLQHVLTSRGFEICQTEAVCMWHRMVWQSYSLDNHLNRALRGVRKLTRLPMPAVAAGESYPKGILQHVRVLPYYWSALLAGLSGQSVDDELVIFARKIPITNGAPTH